MKVPSDLEILEAIYKKYYDEFKSYEKDSPSRSSKIHMPISCREIAKSLNVDGDIVFGRLHYHLEKKYGYKNEDGSRVSFFSLQIGKDNQCVNFPLLASVLAGLQQEQKKFITATAISSFSLAISLISLAIALWSKFAT
ncbi:hypothetical protein [Endozoicomonas sp.]|uniref:hypothetical protein n=1 Tax=Endozoicomonas sp. TaxID=1892382 RepID=UPI00383A12A9